MALNLKFPVQKAVGPRGFTAWIKPVIPKYYLACCDCGLVHEMQFKTADDGLPMFRARRARNYTIQLRKKHY